jgi:hypothetical protein
MFYFENCGIASGFFRMFVACPNLPDGRPAMVSCFSITLSNYRDRLFFFLSVIRRGSSLPQIHRFFRACHHPIFIFLSPHIFAID